jgi:hypothetical protein
VASQARSDIGDQRLATSGQQAISEQKGAISKRRAVSGYVRLVLLADRWPLACRFQLIAFRLLVASCCSPIAT